MRMYSEMTDNGKLPQKIAEQQKIIDFALQKKSKLLQYNVAGQITDRDFIEMTEQCNREISEAERTIADLNETLESSEDFKKHISAVRAAIAAAQNDARKGTISKEFVDTYIDKIYVTPLDDGSMRLSIKIFSGDSTEKFLVKLKRRAGQTKQSSDGSAENQGTSTDSDTTVSMGQTFKKMIEAYENGMK